MKAVSVLYRRLTNAEFNATSGIVTQQNGGGQTYFDFPNGKDSVPDEEMKEFFSHIIPNKNTYGYEWNFIVNNLRLHTTQEATISARSSNRNSLRNQQIGKPSRFDIFKTENGFPESYDETNNPLVLYILKDEDNNYWTGWFFINDYDPSSWYMTVELAQMWDSKKNCKYIKLSKPIPFNIDESRWTFGNQPSYRPSSSEIIAGSNYKDIMSAIKTKPFLLLAGISGTGKSQKVQELAFMSCPKKLREENSTTPGNYCLVEVKPNWHDSTELLGYYSALSGRYELTDFIRFTYKALTNPNTPFFLCLDEMNLAPVEQYFAEYLSVLETRKRIVDEEGVKILTEPLLTKDKFSNCKLNEKVPKQTTGYMLDGDEYDTKPLYSPEDAEIIAYLKNNGLHLPDNLFVIGTVNMDDTTHQFSRKVIDRAFTIEMNGGKMDEMFSTESRNNLEYRTEPLPLSAFKSEFVRAYEVLEDDRFAKYAETTTTRIPELLGNSDGTASEDSINGILNGTPFRVSYRVQNELVLYLSVLIENAGFPDDIESLIGEATLAILMEKVLPRIQGEQKQLETKGGKSNVLKDMKSFVETHFKPSDETVPEIYDKVIKKLEEMDGKLSGYYTNFF